MMSAKLQESTRDDPDNGTDRGDPAPTTTLQNVAASGKSPYVQAQKDSLIRWQLFGQPAIDRARAENKLIFLHIGYSASHYCYLTIHESFSNPKIAQLLNDHFIPIVVDREERPDLDSIYMNYVQSLNSAAGHPLNVFLTPDLEPVFGGTYFPPPGSQQATPDSGEELADFLLVTQKAESAWAEQEMQLRADGKQSVEELRNLLGEGTLGHHDPVPNSSTHPGTDQHRSSDIDIDLLEEAYSHISKTFDTTYGGFLHMPPNPPPNFLSGKIDLSEIAEAYDLVRKTSKFLTPAKLSFLLRAKRFPQTVVDIIGEELVPKCSSFAMQSLRQISAGALHDHVGGGFHRCSVTWDWSLPSFEKMMSDNALALGLYLDASLLVGHANGEFIDEVLELADYLTSAPIRLDGGGFGTSEAADSSQRRGDTTLQHGAYYLWTRKEFDTIIGDGQESSVAAAYWNIQEHGNVEKDQDPADEYLNQNVLRVTKTVPELALQFKIPDADVVALVDSAKTKLRTYREKERARPALDAKIVTAYNGMAIGALARTYSAYKSIDRATRSVEYLTAAIEAATFLKQHLWDAETKTLYRIYYDGGRSNTRAFAEDFAFLIEGLLELYEATGEESWLEWADELQSTQIAQFYDHTQNPSFGLNAKCGAFYRTAQDEPNILVRVKDAMDTSQPSDNAVSASNLFRIGSLLDDKRYLQLAQDTIIAFEAEMLQYPYLFPGLLTAVVAWKMDVTRWIRIRDDDSAMEKYHKSPRAELWTLLFYNPESDFLRRRCQLFEFLDKEKVPGTYTLSGAYLQRL